METKYEFASLHFEVGLAAFAFGLGNFEVDFTKIK